MHIHILGICGTFMGGIAAIAKSMGHHVSGSDANVYPPMSTQLESLGIPLTQGFDPAQLNPEPDVVIIGNAMSRGNPCVEAVLNRNLNYISGPQWLSENVLKQRWVIAASGTHGKTSTASMIAWVLEYAGLQPGFLIGGVPENFGISARLGESPFFVIEADEYDSAFFDKRSKFVHYHPRTLVLNNLEFDHADIFENLAAIQKQFHHLIRILPGNGLALAPANDENIKQVLEQGCWTPVQYLGTDWQVANQNADGSEFDVLLQNKTIGRVNWSLIGQHNIHNGIMAIAAARHAGVKPELAIEALAQFVNAKRRMETRGVVNDITVYDDFAHHPTAIATTIDGLRNKVKEARIFAVLEPRSATMKMGVHHSTLANSWKNADQVLLFQPDNLDWSLQQLTAESAVPSRVYASVDDIIKTLIHEVAPGDHILIMSNGGFGGIHSRLLEQLAQHEI
ncbi:UDP-N-acetylmuramate:L-alanyl-gamma-D-glutamyl-meso-diaminopimelate ligase [Aliiglaciecola sp. 2_MG-2023]|uniref:UDP-N-acetylmuramate:L-alanyl-gamma-D-glutamyl- meso-diaminopimelate ligase n=1 Tax=unclassified Aliiglaciecola TaxID=2593648 RepID=UPI0026E2E7B8|nr:MULTISPECIES: UDP-N-acetylmuramate:L-alanyl-gamma-D-glutamyl-meso-diaminopimelate ligase [unclassified Aliiglaciecola]MDO6712665.1 UDP-N-acetylmuramate:L-alanyl-gamma-D-glutamyl-meso-diaminopimelate ligase [Aliiglaciecola sp. 2_MG-2023]MDO6754392.1 UDP-N-acetylmuramate:L-alanyl-gamma-D-glutamyl-meso-diaminopimelate ligase [Aliiglaciecola sp. 1_MG-2023]